MIFHQDSCQQKTVSVVDFTHYSYVAFHVYGEKRPLQVLCDVKGYFLGAANDLSIVCRDSEYFLDYEGALRALKCRSWKDVSS